MHWFLAFFCLVGFSQIFNFVGESLGYNETNTMCFAEAMNQMINETMPIAISENECWMGFFLFKRFECIERR